MAGKYPSLDEIYICGGDCKKMDEIIAQHPHVVESLKLWYRMSLTGQMTVERYEYLYHSAKLSYGLVGVIL